MSNSHTRSFSISRIAPATPSSIGPLSAGFRPSPHWRPYASRKNIASINTFWPVPIVFRGLITLPAGLLLPYVKVVPDSPVGTFGWPAAAGAVVGWDATLGVACAGALVGAVVGAGLAAGAPVDAGAGPVGVAGPQ